MKIFTPTSTEDSELCHPLREEHFDLIKVLFNGEKRQENWTPLSFHLIKQDEGQYLTPSDSPWLGSHVLIFKQAVVERLGNLLEDFGEFLKLECEDEALFAYNVLNYLPEALDKANSSVIHLKNGDILKIKKYAFHERAISGAHIFKLPDIRLSPIFVSSKIVDAWKAENLSGLCFDQVYSTMT